jgi:twinkle protein
MNAHELSQRLAHEAATVAAYLLPGGKKHGSEWKVGSASGEPGQSLSIRLSGAKAGVWKDFATGDGGDLLDLWATCKGQTMSEAMTEAKAYLGIRDSMPAKEARTFTRPSKPRCQTPKGAVREWLNGRGLEDRTIEAFKIGEQVLVGKTYAVFPYLRDGGLVNAKYRNPADKRDMRQEKDAEPCLYGWHLIDPKARMVAICEGELDSMSLWQAGIPALSVNAGAGNFQWLENDWDRLERFSEILIAFDADEAGEKGAREAITRLGNERCKRLTFANAKDANEYLQAGAAGEDFWHAVRNAKPQDPEELRQAAEFIDRVKAMFYPAEGQPCDPLLRLDKDLPWFEFRRGEITVWTGYNGHGKSLMLSQVMLGLMQQGERFCVFSGEMTPERQLKRMVKQATGLDRPTLDYITAVGEWLRDRVWLFNHVGSAKLDRLLDVFLYANKRYGTRHFVIDSLMMLDVPEDGPGAITAQKAAIQRMADFAKRNGCHVHLVAHPRKGADESKGPGKLDVAGSSKITDAADNVFTVWSARKDQSQPMTDEPDAALELHKQRNGDTQHFRLALWFVSGAMQYSTTSRRRAINYVDWSKDRKPAMESEEQP